ncbi:MAG: hypothetical protein AAFN78_01595 [Pseudomonadota bacterium]
MNHHSRRLALAVAALATAGPVQAEGFLAQFTDPEDGKFDASRFLSENAYGFLPVPIIITEPAVDGGLGAIGLFFHETDEQREQRMKSLREAENGSQYLLTPSVSAVGGAFTGNDSWFVGGGHMGFFGQGSIRYMGGGGYGDVNLDFFGFGEVGLTRPIELNTQAAAILQSLKFRLGKLPVFAGVSQSYVDASIEPGNLGDLSGDFLPPELQERWEEIVRGLLTTDVALSALGVVAELDTRDNFFSPRSGYRYTLEHKWYDEAFGSDIEYRLIEFEGLNYWTFTDRWRAALRLDYTRAQTDELLPPFATPGISLRGIPAARYQGNNVGVVEGELTWQVNFRWSVNVFAGAGWASNDNDDLFDSDSRVARGAGFRYLVARRYGFQMGIDVARGPEDTVFYIQAGSAW